MASARKALGKGLSALIPENLEQEELNKVIEIDIDLIVPNPNQPRKSFEQDKLDELAESIKKYGIIQPIIVKKDGNIYNIIAGERRWRASKNANLKTIPCIIRDIENKNASEIALIENIQREDLNPIDEATAYDYIMDRYAITQEDLSNIVGKSRVYVTNILRLLNLDDYVKGKIVSNEITQGHARAILSLEKSQQIIMVDEIIKRNLSVRDVEKLVKTIKEKKVRKPVEKDKYITNIEECLTNKFAAKVKIINKKNRGKITIEYKNINELNRILNLINFSEEN